MADKMQLSFIVNGGEKIYYYDETSADYINFDAINDDNMAEDDINYVKRFAEVLVDSFIPLDMIENIDNPIKLK